MKLMQKSWAGLKAMFTDSEEMQESEAGATLVEYVLLVIGIALVVIVAVRALGGTITGLFNDTEDCLENGTNCG